MEASALTKPHTQIWDNLPETHRRVILVRHGETDWNASKRFQGHTDIPLNATGVRQAQALAAHLRKLERQLQRPIAHHCISSDLSRAHDTAKLVWGSDGNFRLDAGLRERNYGDLSGLTGDEMEAKHPEAFEGLKARTSHFSLPGGESLHEFNQRVLNAFHTALANHPDEDLLLVAHGGVLDCIYRYCKAESLEKQREWLLPNAAINVLNAPKGSFARLATSDIQIVVWADQTHLVSDQNGPFSDTKDEVDGRVA